MLAMPGGMAVDLEARPGASGELVTIEPTGGVLVHTNHFVATPLVEDVGLSWAPDSPARYARVARLLASRKGAISLELLEEVLRDHAGYPNSICAHLDEADKPSEQGRTAASLVMDLEERCIWLAEGNPCRANYRRLEAIRSS
jgi:isopenicillin-N N-acyltransferase-like protein